jgi:hypothetical protein
MKKIIQFGSLFLVFVIFLIAAYMAGYLKGQKNAIPLIQVQDVTSSKQSTSAIQLPLNKIILVKYGVKYGAIKLIKSVDNSSEIQWWYQVVPSSNFISSKIETGIAKLFEKYERTKITPSASFMKDKGSNLSINFDNVKIEWSADNWIYYSDEYGLLLTDEEDISKVGIAGYYQWTYRTS